MIYHQLTDYYYYYSLRNTQDEGNDSYYITFHSNYKWKVDYYRAKVGETNMTDSVIVSRYPISSMWFSQVHIHCLRAELANKWYERTTMLSCTITE